MTSTTSSREFFREWKALYVWNLRRSRGMILLYLALLLLAGPVLSFLTCSVSSASTGILEPMAGVSSGLSIPLTMIFTLVFAIQRFGYMHNKRSVDLYHAMPVRRTPMLLAAWSASLTGLLLPLLADILLLILSGAAVSMNAFYNVPVGAYFQLFGSQMFMAAVCLTFCMLMAVCSGTVMDMVISIVLTNCSYPLVILMTMVLGSWLLPGFDGNFSLTLLTALAPFPAMVVAMVFAGNYSTYLFGNHYPLDIPGLFWGWWVLLFVVMLAASFWLYTRRKSESAESDLAFPAPKLLLRFLCSAAVGLLAGMVFFLVNNNTVSFFIGFILFSLMAHAVTEALYSRGLRRFVRTLPSYGAMVLCVVLLYLSAATGFFGYDTRMPQNITSVTIEGSDFAYESSFSPEYNPISLYDWESGAILANRNHIVYEEQENIELIKKLHQQLLEERKENGPFYSLINSGSYTRICYQSPQGNLERNFMARYPGDSPVYTLWRQLGDSQESKKQFVPFMADSRGMRKISISSDFPLNVPDEYTSGQASSSTEAGEWTYMDEKGNEWAYNDSSQAYSADLTPNQQQAQKILEVLQKDIEAGTLGTGNYQSNEKNPAYSVYLDLSETFQLTENSPWYELAPESVGKRVYQSGYLSFIATPEMENTYGYLQELLLDPYAGGDKS